MRQLLTFTGVMVVIGMIASTCGHKSIQVSGETLSEKSESEKSSGYFSTDAASQETASIEVESISDYGDTLCEIEGKTYIYSTCDDYDEIETIWDGMISGYKNSVALDSCRVKIGTGFCNADGKTLKITFGVDTMKYDITKLPKILYPMKDLLPKDVKKYSVDYMFSLNDSAMKCKFKFFGYLPDNAPVFVKNYIAGVMYSDLKMIFDDFGDERDYMKEYEKQNLNSKRYLGINTADASPKEIGKYFAKRFDRLYRKEFSNEDDWGPTYEYLMEVSPAWTSKDGKFTTYRFYTYYYGGGAHGMMNEYYLSFDSKTGKILGIKDLYKENEFQNVMVKLGEEVNKRLSRDDEVKSEYRADLGESGQEEIPMGIWYENYNGYVYPRPALVKDGVVYSYQPYDKGCFADGILHFRLPYKK